LARQHSYIFSTCAFQQQLTSGSRIIRGGAGVQAFKLRIHYSLLQQPMAFLCLKHLVRRHLAGLLSQPDAIQTPLSKLAGSVYLYAKTVVSERKFSFNTAGLFPTLASRAFADQVPLLQHIHVLS
jgi:hypothetical protein